LTGTITETARVLDGDCEVSGLDLSLNDAVISTGPAAGYNLLTWLSSTNFNELSSTIITDNSSVAINQLDVANPSIFSVNSYAWCEQEALYITGISGNTISYTPAQLGTKKGLHSLLANEGIYPAIYLRMPWIVRRKAIVWGISEANVATVLWEGFTSTTAPKLDETGVRFNLELEHIWTVIKQSNPGFARGNVELTGWGDLALIQSQVIFNHDTSSVAITSQNEATRTTSANVALQSFVQNTDDRVASAAAFSADYCNCYMRRNGKSATVFLDFTMDISSSSPEISAKLYVPSGDPLEKTEWIDGDVQDRDFHPFANSRTVAVTWDIPKVPEVYYFLKLNGALSAFGCRSNYSIDNYTINTPPSIGRTLSVTKGLRLEVNDDFYADFSSLVTYTSGYFEGIVSLTPRHPSTPDTRFVFGLNITDPKPLRVCTFIRCGHWLDGIRYGLFNQNNELDADTECNWDEFDNIYNLTSGLNTARFWCLDGTRSMESLIKETLQLNGCTLGAKLGKLCIISWQWPDAKETPNLTISTADLISDFTGWEVYSEAFANRVNLKSQGLELNIVNQASVNQFGAGRTLSIDLSEVDFERIKRLQPIELYQQLLSRLDLWSQPAFVCTVALPITYWTDTETQLGKTVQITEWSAPNGNGSRGLSSQLTRIVEREIDLDNGELRLKLLLWGNQTHSYAPCAKIKNRNGTSKVRLDENYVNGTDEYSDNALGSSDFATGDKVRLLTRDSTTLTEQSLTISTIAWTGSDWEITFTGAINSTFKTAIDAGDWVDLTLDYYSIQQTNAKKWAFVGDLDDNLIEDLDAAHKIAP
jgi:hypothetical protein